MSNDKNVEISPKVFNTLRFWVSLIASLCTLALTYHLWMPRGIHISFDYKVEHLVNLQVFYAASKTEPWSQYRSEEYEILDKKGKAKIFLPTEKLGRLRIDFGKKPGNVQFSGLQIEGLGKVSVQEKDFIKKNLKLVSNVKDGFSFYSNHKDPFIEYKRPLNVQALPKIHFNIVNFLLLALCPIYLVYVLFDYRKEIKEGKKRGVCLLL